MTAVRRFRRRRDGAMARVVTWDGTPGARAALEALGVAIRDPDEVCPEHLLLTFRIAAWDWAGGVVKAGDVVPARIPLRYAYVVLVPEDDHGAGVVVYRPDNLVPLSNVWEEIR